MRPDINGIVVIPKQSYLLRVNIQPWLDKLPYDQYVMVHCQCSPVGNRKWGILSVDSGQVHYLEASKIESCQPHEGWKLSLDVSDVPPMAFVYPACKVEIDTKGTASVESVGFDQSLNELMTA